MLSALGVVVLYALGELLLVRWTLAAVDRNPVRASLNAGAIRALAAIGILAVVASPMLIVAAIVGDMIGSYVGVSMGDYEEEDDDGSEGDDWEEAGSRRARAARQCTRDGKTWEDYSSAGGFDR